MILGTFQEVEILDPHKIGLRNNKNVWDGLYNTLTQWAFDGSGVPESQLAQSWETSSDGLTWTFTIPDNAFFHDGRKVTAADVKYSFDRIFDPETGSPAVRKIQQIDSTDVIDDTTFRFNLSAPNGALLVGLIDARIVEKNNVETDQISKFGIGTNAFKLIEYVVHDRVVMDKFEDYFGVGADGQNLPYMDGVTVQTLPDSTALFTALITGLVDTFWQMTPKFMLQMDALPDAPALASDSGIKSAFDNFFWEWDRGIFADARARKAILISLDRATANHAGYGGLAAENPTNSFFPLGGPFTNPDLKEFTRDVPAATALWKEVFDEYGEQQITFLYTAISPEFRPMSLVHQQNMAEVGITDLDIRLVSIQKFFDELALGGRTPTWQTENMMAPNISFRTTEPTDTLASWECGGHWASHYCNEELDVFIKQGRESSDFLVRQKAYFGYQEKAQEVIPSYVTSWRAVGHGMSKRLQNFRSNFGDFYYIQSWLKQ